MANPGQQFGNHPAGDIHAAETHDGQGQIPGLGAVDTQQDVNRRLTGGTPGVHPGLADHRRRILGSHPFLQPGSQLPTLSLDQEAPDLDQARTGYEPFIRDMRVVPAEIAEQAIFEVSARGKIDVAALGCGGSILPAVPKQKSLAQTRTRSNDRPVSTALTTRVEALELFRAEAQDAVRRRLKVVHQPHLSPAEVAAQTGRFDLPGQVCGGDASVQNRPGNAKRRRPDRFLTVEKGVENLFQPRIADAGKRPLAHQNQRCVPFPSGVVEGKIGLRPANIPGYNIAGHRRVS